MGDVKGARGLRMPFFSFSWTEQPQTGNAGGARSRGKNMKDRRPKGTGVSCVCGKIEV